MGSPGDNEGTGAGWTSASDPLDGNAVAEGNIMMAAIATTKIIAALPADFIASPGVILA